MKWKRNKGLWTNEINLLLDWKRGRGEGLLGADMRMTCNKRWASAATKQGQGLGNVSTWKRTREEERLGHGQLLLSPSFWRHRSFVTLPETYPRGGGGWIKRSEGEKGREAADVVEESRWEKLEVWSVSLLEAGSGEQIDEGGNWVMSGGGGCEGRNPNV